MPVTFIAMKSPAWLKTYVEGLDIVPNTKYRSDCPVCAKKNTFSVVDNGLQRMWFCFHADCNVSGRTGVTLSRTSASTVFERSAAAAPPPRTNNTYEIPDTFVSVSRRVEAESYLRRVGAYDAYLSGAADIRYDVRMNRVVFLVKENKKVVDAAGRSLDGRGPKWYRYNSSKYPFVCGSHTAGIVVEDCASACTCSSVAAGVALLGTNLLTEHIEVLKQYERVFVALDKDATDKAITMVRTLHSHVPTRLMVLHTDLKNMEKDERNDFLRSHINR
tara:strand:- start:7748 stop:8572 length:825 start_codon:yes stop_codon:yes gene_type:complete